MIFIFRSYPIKIYFIHVKLFLVKNKINFCFFFSFHSIDDEKCKGVENFGSYMCFTFQIPDDMDYRDVDAAELWVYRQPDPNANEAQSFLISEIESWGSKKINKPFAIHYANSSGM